MKFKITAEYTVPKFHAKIIEKVPDDVLAETAKEQVIGVLAKEGFVLTGFEIEKDPPPVTPVAVENPKDPKLPPTLAISKY